MLIGHMRPPWRRAQRLVLLAALMTVATGLREARRVGKDGELSAHEIAGCDANPVCLPRLAAPL